MIEFSGIVSDTIKKKVVKQRDTQMAWINLGGTILGIIATVVYSIVDNSVAWDFLVPTLCIFFLTIYFFVVPQSGSVFRFNWNYVVRIEDGMISKIQTNQKSLIKPLNRVKKVVDYGEFYIVKYSGVSNAIICEKKLLTIGTLEEFEALFQGKIERKCKK